MSGGTPAARVGDPIAHSNAGRDMVIGALIGLAAGAVLVGATIATGGAALAVVAAVGGAAGLTSFGGLKGMFIGEASMGPPTGKLVVGSTNVRINGRFATMTERGQATCDDHSGQIPLATGAATVLINGLPAGRIGEKLGCSALVVAPCSPDVIIGGPTVADPNVVVTPEVPAWAVTGLQVLGIAGAVMALPYAIATVGVAATIGGGVAGYFGGEYGGKAARALGTAMGMSETGIRSMEAGGQFLGGMFGGAAGVKGVQAGEGALAGLGGRPVATSPATDFARGWQGKGDYPGVDSWKDEPLATGDVVYGGAPGQSNFYMTKDSYLASGGDKAALWEGLQVKPHPEFGYRPAVQAYRVTQPTPAASATTLANPQYGSGGFDQIAIQDYSSLEPIGDPIQLR